MLKEDGEQAKLNAILIPMYVLQAASCYFVLLIVFLRLRSIKHPMTFQTTHKKLSNIVSATIWIVLFLLGTISLIASFPPVYNKTAYTIGKIILNLIFWVFPLLATIIMYVVLLYTLKKDTNSTVESTQLRNTKKTNAKLTKGVVICLVVCNAPYVLWVNYLGVNDPNGGYSANVFNTNFRV